jgi:hypothetical protein
VTAANHLKIVEVDRENRVITFDGVCNTAGGVVRVDDHSVLDGGVWSLKEMDFEKPKPPNRHERRARAKRERRELKWQR